MKLHKLQTVCISVLLLAAGPAFLNCQGYGDEKTLVATKPLNMNFTLYSGVSMAAGYTLEGNAYPQISTASGVRLLPWLAVGAFLQGAPLSDIAEWNNGISIAESDNSYMLMSGTEVIFTPFAKAVVHPFFRLTIGGITTGYLENTDDDEDMERSVEKRDFFASLGVGAEANLSTHIKLYFMAGGKVATNREWNGLTEGSLSGAEASVGMRIQWGSAIR